MRIWIDGKEANVSQRLGSGQVAFELLRNLEKIDRKNEYTILLPNPPIEDLPKERIGWKYKILKPNKLWTRIALPLALYSSKQKPNLIFSPTHYIPRFSPVKRVVTIFDLAYLHFPEMFNKADLYKLNNWTKFSAQNSDAIVTISKSTKRDIVDFYKIDPKKVTVTYPGFKEEIYYKLTDKEKIKEVCLKYKTGDNYIIYIGTLQPRKNLIRLINALVKIEDLKLVVVGKTSGEGREGWMYDDILSRPKILNIENRVIFTGFVPDEELNCLLNGAQAFILPSLYEGFGIPVVDAMAAGIPVIVSNVSSLPEVVGKAGLLVDPYSEDQIEQAIRTITTDKKLHSKLSKLGRQQYRKFSWKKMAKEVLRVFQEVTEGHPERPKGVEGSL